MKKKMASLSIALLPLHPSYSPLLEGWHEGVPFTQITMEREILRSVLCRGLVTAIMKRDSIFNMWLQKGR